MILLLRKDLYQEARRARTFVVRAGLVLVVFSLVWLAHFDMSGLPKEPGGALGQKIFMTLAMGIVGVVTVVAPVLTVPSAVADVESRTIDMLITTDIPVRRIVHAKVQAGVLATAAVVLACAPVMALSTYYGGVAPMQAATIFIVLLSLCVLFVAICVEKALMKGTLRSATVATIKWLVKYNLITLLCVLNPFIVVFRCALRPDTASSIFAAAAVGLNLIWALRSIRRSVKAIEGELTGAVGEPPQRSRLSFWRAVAPKGFFRRSPIAWKEMLHPAFTGLYGVNLFLVSGLLLPDIVALVAVLPGGDDPSPYFAFAAGAHVVMALGFIVLLMSLAISSERQGKTLDLLLLTGISPMELLREKMRGLRMALRILAISFVAHAIALLLTSLSHGDGVIIAFAVGLVCILAMLAFYACASIFVSTLSDSPSRSMPLAAGVLLAGIVLPPALAPALGGSEFIAHLGLFHVLFRWPEKLHLGATAAAAALAIAGAVVTLKLAARRVERVG